MSVLYRKYRPSIWSEVVGQDHIVNILKETVKSEKISHAYLFSGSRGTGKTSLARILAKSLETKEEDIYEIDAASNRGIDDIRHLREHVATLPFSSVYKIYIIDEVHMLSKDAWNALLKTLEEPPKHVVFILATTELEKVPETIISRCQTFTFNRPNRETTRKLIEKVAKSEKRNIDHGSSDLIAILADGSFRDALGILEKILNNTSGDIKRDKVEDITGTPKSQIVNELIESILENKVDSAILCVQKLNDQGISMKLFMSLLIEKMRFIFLLQNSPGSLSKIKQSVSSDDLVFIENQAKKKLLSPKKLSNLLKVIPEIERATIESLPLELAIVDICV
jgi:DNA polymerase-3 subunit gamma/tau